MASDYIPGFPSHPHRGFETITATTVGLIDHADSAGNAGRYGDGDLQWMTAGKGIVHSEMFPLVHAAPRENPLRLFQIWLNLPSKDKMVEPSFAMFWSETVPEWTSGDGRASVTAWAGDYFLGGGEQNRPPPDSWAADPDNDVAVLHMKVQPGGQLEIPRSNRDGVNRALYLIEGQSNGVLVDGKAMNERVCITLDASKSVSINLPQSTGSGRTEFLLLQGRPIGEPVAQHGPFVMNTQQEIHEAFLDYQRTRFGGWPWEREDMVFDQGRGRFALIGGKEIRPVERKENNEEL